MSSFPLRPSLILFWPAFSGSLLTPTSAIHDRLFGSVPIAPSADVRHSSSANSGGSRIRGMT